MKTFLITTIFVFTCLGIYAQETSKDNYYGQWSDNNSWVGGWTGGSPSLKDLPKTNANITIKGYIQVGYSPAPTAGSGAVLSFETGYENRQFTVNDTLVVYGDVTFKNKAMDLVMGPGAVFIVFGNLSMDNKIEISSNGTLIVTGAFNKVGSQGSYTGSGNVYAGTFSGSSQTFIDTGAGDGDSSFPIDSLSNDGFGDLETFINNNGGPNPLPIKLNYFNGKQIDNSVNIFWQTATEINNNYFTIERSTDGINYTIIEAVQGAGNSLNVINYSITDYNPLNGIAYYRLTQTDYDGKFETFNPISVYCAKEAFIKIGPNPAISTLNITLDNNMTNGTIEIYNVVGSKIKQVDFSDSYSTIDIGGMPKGRYMIVIIGNSNRVVKSFMKE